MALMQSAITSDSLLLFVRIALAFVLLKGHGWKKILDLKQNAKNFSMMGFKPGVFWGTFIALLETVGVVMLVLGIYVHLVAALIGAMMLTGIVWKKKIGKTIGAYELDIMIFSLALMVMAFGTGSYSLVAFPYSFFTWDWALVAIVVAVVLAYLDKILGTPYKKWKA